MKKASKHLPCSGCAHSAAEASFPGHPSGERPCCFCVRNPEGIKPELLHPRDSPEAPESKEGVWYDGTPAYKTPMDCYISTDRLVQQQIFSALDAIERKEQDVEDWPANPLGFDSEEAEKVQHPCCSGGRAPGGHAFDCIVILGFCYG